MSLRVVKSVVKALSINVSRTQLVRLAHASRYIHKRSLTAINVSLTQHISFEHILLTTYLCDHHTMLTTCVGGATRFARGRGVTINTPMTIAIHLDHISHCKATPGTNWSNKWTH